jgi:hypothetical protein
MVSICVSGVLISEVHTSTNSTHVERAQFTVLADDPGSLPLRFEVVAFGVQAERAATFLKTGTRVNLFGRMSAGGDSKRVTVGMSAFEIQGGPDAQ